MKKRQIIVNTNIRLITNSLTPEKFKTPIDEANDVETKIGKIILVILTLFFIFQIDTNNILVMKLIIKTIESTIEATLLIYASLS